jgi:uncharacterized protein with GYD domain
MAKATPTQFGQIHRKGHLGRLANDTTGGRLGGQVALDGRYHQSDDTIRYASSRCPDEETATSVLLAADMPGNIRTRTMRAFTASEMDKILARMPELCRLYPLAQIQL